MTYQDEILDKLNKIHTLLLEAYSHYFVYETHCKSSEGIVSLHFPNFWDLRAGETEPSVEIFSYALTNGRTHHFDSLDKALEEVKKWHKAEMETDRSIEDQDFAEKEEYNIKFVKF
jgi:hypothetical protein